MSSAKKILVAPLDWGLGHATRCMPIIDALLQMSHEVILASDGRALKLLQAEYPQLQTLTLPGYQPIYPENGNMVWAMGKQLPKFMQAIKAEHDTLNEWIDEHQLDAVIADNRYGMWSKKIPCVFITHQLFIRMPVQAAMLEGVVAKTNQKFISRFDECWVPDWPGKENLSGELSHRDQLPENLHFIGPLSRLVIGEKPKQYNVTALLSGPEPQRSQLEEIIIHQMRELDQQCLVIRGVTDTQERKHLSHGIEVVNYLTREKLNEVLLQSEIIIARSGYSTVMDLVKLKKDAILIPTPGQTEQEYLADYLFMKGYYYYQKQKELNLPMALEERYGFTLPKENFPEEDLLQRKLTEWVNSL